MTIYNLSGNFQPATDNNGRSLPSSNGRAASTENVESESPLQPSVPIESATKVDSISEQREAANEIESVRNQIEELKNFNQSIDRSLQFKVDDELGVTIVRVVDRSTDELIRQFPPEELINLSKRLKALNEEGTTNSGVLLKEKV